MESIEQLSVNGGSHDHHHLYDIFLSHSRKQHKIINNLNTKLCSMGYSVFFHNIYVKLPPGQTFPDALFTAAHNCKLAIVSVSREFLTSQWPMIELSLFADLLCQDRCDDDHVSTPPFTILPLFLNLSPEDLSNETNLMEWREIWRAFEAQDERCNAQKWEDAVKLLPGLKGILQCSDYDSEEEEASFIEEVINAIGAILPIHI